MRGWGKGASGVRWEGGRGGGERGTGTGNLCDTDEEEEGTEGGVVADLLLTKAVINVGIRQRTRRQQALALRPEYAWGSEAQREANRYNISLLGTESCAR